MAKDRQQSRPGATRLGRFGESASSRRSLGRKIFIKQTMVIVEETNTSHRETGKRHLCIRAQRL